MAFLLKYLHTMTVEELAVAWLHQYPADMSINPGYYFTFIIAVYVCKNLGRVSVFNFVVNCSDAFDSSDK